MKEDTKIKPAVRLTKRIVLGKHQPPKILRFLCWFTIIWSSIIAIFMLVTGVFTASHQSIVDGNELLQQFPKEFKYLYGFTHLISVLSAILMYRLNKTGFYLYCISNIAVTVYPFIYLSSAGASYVQIAFTLIMIGLFATQVKKMN